MQYLAERSELRSCKRLQEVQFGLCQEHKSSRSVVVLQRLLVIVPHSKRVRRVDEEVCVHACTTGQQVQCKSGAGLDGATLHHACAPASPTHLGAQSHARWLPHSMPSSPGSWLRQIQAQVHLRQWQKHVHDQAKISPESINTGLLHNPCSTAGPCFNSTCMDCSTSAACVALWYGLTSR